MSAYSWREMLVESQADGAALTNSTTATSLLPTAAKYMLPANHFSRIGKKLIVKGGYRLSNLVTTPGTLTLDIRLGSVIVFTSGALQMSATANTNATGRFEVELTARTIGGSTTATLFGEGEAKCVAFSVQPTMLPATAPAVGTGFDSTAAALIDCFGTFSIASASNSITLHDFTVESVN